MEKICDACDFLSRPFDGLLETEYWRIGLGDNQAYLGRAYMTLKTHKGSLSELSTEEWADFESTVQKLESAYRKAFNATPLNWGCYMNHAFRTEPVNPHVHWHIYPRMKSPVTIGGKTFSDPLYGEFYDNKLENLVDDDMVQAITERIKAYL